MSKDDYRVSYRNTSDLYYFLGNSDFGCVYIDLEDEFKYFYPMASAQCICSFHNDDEHTICRVPCVLPWKVRNTMFLVMSRLWGIASVGHWDGAPVLLYALVDDFPRRFFKCQTISDWHSRNNYFCSSCNSADDPYDICRSSIWDMRWCLVENICSLVLFRIFQHRYDHDDFVRASYSEI